MLCLFLFAAVNAPLGAQDKAALDAALVRIPGASHDIAARPSHLLAHTAYVLQWFETHRKK